MGNNVTTANNVITANNVTTDGDGAVTPFDTSPLGDRQKWSHNCAAVSVEALPWCVKIILRGDSADTAFLAAVESVCGMSPPLKANTCTHKQQGDDRISLIWLGPDEWQYRLENFTLNSPIDEADLWVSKFRSALGNVHAAVVDVSDYYVLIQLSGSARFEVLEKGTPLNVRRTLHQPSPHQPWQHQPWQHQPWQHQPWQHQPWQCAQTRFGQAPIMLSNQSVEGEIQIQVRATFAVYLWQYLTEAALEYTDQ